MKFGLLNSRQDSQYNGTEFVEISRIFGTQDAFALEQGDLMGYSWQCLCFGG